MYKISKCIRHRDSYLWKHCGSMRHRYRTKQKPIADNSYDFSEVWNPDSDLSVWIPTCNIYGWEASNWKFWLIVILIHDPFFNLTSFYWCADAIHSYCICCNYVNIPTSIHHIDKHLLLFFLSNLAHFSHAVLAISVCHETQRTVQKILLLGAWPMQDQICTAVMISQVLLSVQATTKNPTRHN